MAVSSATATVPEAFTQDDRTPPIVEGDSGGPVAGDEPGGRSRTRRLALVGACVFAFALGFAAMTALTRGSDGASSPKTKATQPAPAGSAPAAPAPAPSMAKAPPSAPAPPSSALVGAVANDQAPVPQPSPPMPQTGNAGSPTPSTTTPVPSTTTPTTTPSTTTP